MKLLVYTVYDKAVGAYLPPWYSRATGEALRSFSDACNSPDSNFYKYPSDYVMFLLGEFDDGSGLFASIEPMRVISAQECRVSAQALNVDGGPASERAAADAATFGRPR